MGISLRRLRRSPSRILARLVSAAAAGAVLAFGTVAPVAAADPTCSFRSDRIVKVTMTQNSTAIIRRDAAGLITVNGSCSHPFGPPPDVWNTKQVKVTGGDGMQGLRIDLDYGGFMPGLGQEAGASDEIEFVVLLGAGDDWISVRGSAGPDAIRLGTKGSGGSPNLPIPRINLNANESDGVDDDVTHLGVELVIALGLDGGDSLSGDGGAGTGGPSAIPMALYGGRGPDALTGGSDDDFLQGDGGGDTLKGLKGADTLYAFDGINGNDASLGGAGSDTCTSDAGDSETSCDD